MNMKKIFSFMLAALIAVGSFSPLGLAGTSAQAVSFRDVSSSAWYADVIDQITDAGYMDGTDVGVFSPDETLTRAMFVTVLGRIHGVKPEHYDYTVFVDAPKESWYGPYVSWAYSIRIVDGYGNSGYGFGSEDPITREQMATIIARYVDFLKVELPDGEETVSSFRDASRVSEYAREGLELMRRTGIIVGDENRNFNPRNNATRAEAATIFIRLSEALDTAGEEVDEFEESIQTVLDVYEAPELKEYAQAYSEASTESERKECGEDIFEYFVDLELDGLIDSVIWSNTYNVIDFNTTNGIHCMYELMTDEDVATFGNSHAASVTPPVYAASTTETSNGLYLSNDKAVILSSFPKTTDDYTKTYLDLIGTLDNAQTRTDLDVTYYEDAVVSDYRNLHDSSVIVINSHGSVSNSKPVICLEEEVDPGKNEDYKNELSKGWIGIYASTKKSDGRYLIYPEFFTGVYGSNGLDGSLIHLCCCEGMSNDVLSDALLAAGAETVSGYSASVTTTYDETCVEAYFGALMEGKSVAVAYVDVSDAVGGKADSYAGAMFMIEGNRTVYLVNRQQLTGTVFDDDATGIAGATVALQYEGTTLASTTTTEDGSYSLPCDWEKTGYTLVVTAAGYATKEELLYTQVASCDVTLMPATGNMQITLKTADAKSLDSYYIIVRNSAGATMWEQNNGESSFTAENSVTHTTNTLAVNAEYKIIAGASDYTPVTYTVTMSDKQQPFPVEIELYRGTCGFKGKVVDDANSFPIQGVKAELVSKEDGAVCGTATTDSTGSFQVMASAGQTEYRLRLSGSGYVTVEDAASGWLLDLDNPVDIGTVRMTATGGEIQPEEPDGPQDDGEYTMLYTEEDLASISGKSGKFMLANDIVATEYGKRIGSLIKTLAEDAVLDGNGHTIQIYVTQQYDGGIVGTNLGTIRNLNVTGTVDLDGSATTIFGGIVSQNGGLIENCTFDGTIRGSAGFENSIPIGGICGMNYGGTIRGCTMNGSIAFTAQGARWKVGGICGYADTDTLIEDCINHADINIQITGSEGDYYSAYVGGICGHANGYQTNKIIHCLNTATLEADTTIGVTYVSAACGWSGDCTECGNTGTRIYAGYGEKPSYMDSAVDPWGGYTINGVILFDSSKGRRNPTETASLKIRSASEILAMW